MLGPSVTHMIDKITSNKYETLRLEQIIISDDIAGKTKKDLNVEQFKNTLLIAIQSGNEIKFKPDDDYVISKGDLLLVLTTPDERIAIQNIK
ncbi:MAG: TrkA C-terminal domain-containing protein [Ignavibacteria bacterium]